MSRWRLEGRRRCLEGAGEGGDGEVLGVDGAWEKVGVGIVFGGGRGREVGLRIRKLADHPLSLC